MPSQIMAQRKKTRFALQSEFVCVRPVVFDLLLNPSVGKGLRASAVADQQKAINKREKTDGLYFSFPSSSNCGPLLRKRKTVDQANACRHMNVSLIAFSFLIEVAHKKMKGNKEK